MGRFTASQTVELKVSAKRIWIGVIEDAHNCLPKCAADQVDSIEYDRPAPEAGCVRTVKTHHHGIVKERFEEFDKENRKVKICLLEGAALNVFKEIKLTLEFKEAVHGCNLEGTVEYESETEQPPKEEIIGFVKAVEAYLIAHPDVYA